MTTETFYEFDPSATDGGSGITEMGGVSTPSFPIIQWINGNPALSALKDGLGYTGGFLFVTSGRSDQTDEQREKAEVIGTALVGAGWKETSHVFRGGDEVQGVWARQAAFSVVAIRRAWVGETAGETKYYPWSVKNAYATAKSASDKKPSSKTHALVLVKGAEAVGPLTLTLSGNAGKGFDDSLKIFMNTVIGTANRMSAETAKTKGTQAVRWALSSFWMAVGADRTKDGKPKFSEVGKGTDTSKVTLPILLGVDGDVDLRRFYVGPEMTKTARTIWDENEEWRHAWDNPGEPSQNSAPAATPAKNADTANLDALKELGLA